MQVEGGDMYFCDTLNKVQVIMMKAALKLFRTLKHHLPYINIMILYSVAFYLSIMDTH